MTSIDLLIQCLMGSRLSWSGQCSPKVYLSCHFMWSFLICLYSDVLVLIVVHFVITWGSVFLRCLSVCYNICDCNWFWFSPIAVVGWYANVSNSWYQTLHDVRLGADFITPTLLCLLPFSKLVFFVSIALHDGCISCSLYEMYIFLCCSDLCPLLR